MPFLFVDYDQGAGGEFFCHNLSLENGCIPLHITSVTSTNRTKIKDSFEQEFLKNPPQICFKNSHPELYDIVPSHRNTFVAKEFNLNFKSIRISFPKDENFCNFLNYQRCKKVLFSKMPNKRFFIGELDHLSRQTNNKEWIKKASYEMDYLSLLMLSRGIELTEENKKHYLNSLLSYREDEPDFSYDLVIPYENLFTNIESVKKDILTTFGINIQKDWLVNFKKEYDEYNTQNRFNDSIFL